MLTTLDLPTLQQRRVSAKLIIIMMYKIDNEYIHIPKDFLNLIGPSNKELIH